MDHDTVFRSAFIVESVQVRIASKSQRKFAILIISDGIERQELPIWSDLYEEKSHLLLENQLLYAVLQVEKKEGETRISCRWLDDLTKANETMIEACDQAYDKAKFQAAKFAKAKETAAKSPKETGKTKMSPAEKRNGKATMTDPHVNQLQIKLDADKARLSHIMQLKRLFNQHMGETPVQIHFHSSAKQLATLHIDAKWGINFSDEVKQKIAELHCVLSIEMPY